jgi:hypothetical protein
MSETVIRKIYEDLYDYRPRRSLQNIMRKILGFAFRMQVGKTTCAKYLESKYDFRRDSFARSLKDGIGKTVFGLTDEQLNDPIMKETMDPFWEMTPRKIMQLAGTEAMRNTFDQDIWVKTLLKRISATPDKISFAIDDVRYHNEAAAIKKMGGKIILINREYSIYPSHTHISETEMASYQDYDGVLDNSGTFTYLYKQLDKLIEQFYPKESND